MKCKLLPLCIPPRGMSQLPCKLESEGLLIVLCQTKAVSKQKWSSFRPVVIWAYRAGDLEGNYCCRCCVTRLECLKAPSWGPTFVSFFHSLCGDCVHVCVCVPMCGPWGYCQTDHGSWCELGRLSVSTYMPLFTKRGERKEEKERRESRDVRWGVTTEGWSKRIPQHAQNMSAGGCKPSKIHRHPTS